MKKYVSRPLSNHDIRYIFLKDIYAKKYFLGNIIAIGNPNIVNIIENIKPPKFVIINTAGKNKPGLHWVLVFYFKNITIFLDPFGFNPQFYNFLYIHNRKDVPLLRNTWRGGQQPLAVDSYYCGHYVVLYGLLLSRGIKLEDINNCFTKFPRINDSIANDIVKWLINRINKKLIKKSKLKLKMMTY